MLDDSDIHASRHARALSLLAGGAKRQGPDGGGPVAVIASPA